MCLAIYKPAETKPDWNAYENGFLQNDDSWGFAAVADGQIVTACGLGKFAEFREAFEPYADKQAIIHFRWATHGKKDTGNCHPFMVADDLAVIHNGVIEIKCNVNADRSDTWHFNELVLKPMHGRDGDFYRRPEVAYTQELAHSGSKFVFLRADGDYEIWNAADGEWEKDGHWYSNDSYEGWRSRWYTSKSSTTTPVSSEKGSMGFSTSVSVDLSKQGKATTDWQYEDDDEYLRRKGESCLLADPYLGEDESEEDFYTQVRVDDLRTHGLSTECIEEVLHLFGQFGIEALHDAI